jgi:hypothetical protein
MMQEFRSTLSKASQCRLADLGRRRAGDPPDLRKPFHEVDPSCERARLQLRAHRIKRLQQQRAKPTLRGKRRPAERGVELFEFRRQSPQRLLHDPPDRPQRMILRNSRLTAGASRAGARDRLVARRQPMAQEGWRSCLRKADAAQPLVQPLVLQYPELGGASLARPVRYGASNWLGTLIAMRSPGGPRSGRHPRSTAPPSRPPHPRSLQRVAAGARF